MLIAVFGDLHGKILLAYKLCQRWQKEHKKNLDLILQVGDLGMWPDINKLDKATIRHIDADENELGFIDFIAGSETLDDLFLNKDFALPDLYFIKGNHEDFDFLQQFRSVLPVDLYHKLIYLPNGTVHACGINNEGISIAALGGIDKDYDGKGKRHQNAYFTQSEITQLSARGSVDVLLTHHGYYAKRGLSEPIKNLRRTLMPKYHFYGHLHREEQISVEKGIKLVQLNLLGFRRESGMLTKQAFGILEWHDKDNHKFEFVEDEWMKEYTKYSWDKKYL
ncbi:MAG: metallophosphoesterase [Candidatus Woesearchaeota archaeon]